MRMFGAGIYMQTAEQFAAKAVLGQHAPYCVLHEALRMLGADLRRRVLTLPARISGVCENHTVSPLLSSHLYLFGIDNDYMVATIHMRSVAGLVLTLNDMCNLAGYPPQNLIFCIHQHPGLLYSCLIGMGGFVTLMIHVSYFKIDKMNPSLKKGHKGKWMPPYMQTRLNFWSYDGSTALAAFTRLALTAGVRP